MLKSLAYAQIFSMVRQVLQELSLLGSALPLPARSPREAKLETSSGR